MRFCIGLFLFQCLTICLDAQNVELKHPIDLQLEVCHATPENQTTYGMIQCESDAQTAWDTELNESYQQLMKVLKPAEKQKLRESQRAWMKFRDLEFDFSDHMHYEMSGTMYRVMAAGRRTEFIRQRALDLKQYYKTYSLE